MRLMLKLLGDDQTAIEVTRAKTLLGQALLRKGNFGEAEPLVREALEAHLAAGRHGERLRVANLLSHAYRTNGRVDAAEKLLKETVQACRDKEGDRASHTLHFIFQLGNLLSNDDEKLGEAEIMLREAVVGLKEAMGADREDTLNATGALAMLLRKRKKEREAEPLLVDTLERARTKLGKEHRITLSILNNLGVMWSAEGRLDESEALYREALATKRNVMGSQNLSSLNTIHNLGTLLHRMRKDDEAHELLAEEFRERRALQGPRERDTLKVMCALGRVCADKGDTKEGERLLKECLEMSVVAFGSSGVPDDLIYQCASDLATVLEKDGRASEAKPMKELAAKHEPPDETEEERNARRSVVE